MKNINFEKLNSKKHQNSLVYDFHILFRIENKYIQF